MPFLPAFNVREQALADDGPQAHGQLGADIALHVLGEQVGKAGDGPLGIAGVQAAEDQVPGFGGTQGHLGRFAVAYLAHQDGVRVLAQAVLQAVGKAQHIGTHLALADHRIGGPGEKVLDRLLDGDDAVAARLVQDVDDHRQGGGLARPGGAGHDDQPIADIGQALGQDGREAGPLEIGDGRRHQAQACPQLPADVEDVGPEAMKLAVYRQLE